MNLDEYKRHLRGRIVQNIETLEVEGYIDFTTAQLILQELLKEL